PVGRTVKTLNLSRMKLGSRGAEIVARMLRNNDTLKHLIVHDNRLGSKDGEEQDSDRPIGHDSGCKILIDAQRARATGLMIDFGDQNWLSKDEEKLVTASVFDCSKKLLFAE
ncbi:MAG: hypothetical protein ACHQUC_07590, partial [Chlamydiales bacterium]